MVGPLGVIPPLPPGLVIRRDQWPRVYSALHLISTTGISTRIEILSQLGAPGEGGWGQKLFVTLRREHLVDYRVIGRGRSRVSLARLTPWGERLCRSLQIWPVKSEWAKLIEKHAGSIQESHTAAVLLFCFYARKFGYQIELMPSVNLDECEPDAKLSRGSEVIYVEVERLPRRNIKLQKWLNQERLQGRVAVCTTGPQQRKRLVAVLQFYHLHGYATDLLSLRGRRSDLWVDEF